MAKKEIKRERRKKALKSAGRKVRNVAKSRIVKRFIPLFGLIAIFTPRGPVHALTIDVGQGIESYGKNGTFFAIGYEGTRQVVKHGVSSIPDLKVRAAVSTTGSIAAMVAGVGFGLGTAICSAMGWEQKAVICVQGLGVCAGASTGMHEGDPSNPATIPGKVAAEAASTFTQNSA